ncbi:MAG: hypothetical protein HOY69_31820 [Streptomyces sp.]|nr:hypothetical protein [Streptomyces sp.]
MRRIPKRWVALGAAAAAIVTVAAVRSGTPHGGGSGPDVRTGASAPPQPLQAFAVARQEFGLLAGGGWAAAWNLWTADAQRSVPQAEFVQVNTACRPELGVPYTIDEQTVTDPATVRVTWHRGDTAGANTLHYTAGRWRFAPDARTVAGYRLGADRLIRQRRAANSCH